MRQYKYVRKRNMMKTRCIWALYKGEDCLSIGTMKEIAEDQNVKIETIRFLASPTYKRRAKDSIKRKQLVLIEKVK